MEFLIFLAICVVAYILDDKLTLIASAMLYPDETRKELEEEMRKKIAKATEQN